MARWQCRPSLLPSFIMPCPCGGTMKMALGEPAIEADGTENLSYRCSICRIELAATRRTVDADEAGAHEPAS